MPRPGIEVPDGMRRASPPTTSVPRRERVINRRRRATPPGSCIVAEAVAPSPSLRQKTFLDGSLEHMIKPLLQRQKSR